MDNNVLCRAAIYIVVHEVKYKIIVYRCTSEMDENSILRITDVCTGINFPTSMHLWYICFTGRINLGGDSLKCHYSSTNLHITDHDFYIPIDIVWYLRLAIEGRDPGFNAWVGRFFLSSFLACDTILLAPFTTKDGSREGGRETETCHD